MDSVIRELDNKILQYDFDGRLTDVACCNKIKMDYFLMLTIAATWDLKHPSMDDTSNDAVMTCLQRPETGKLIRLLDSVFGLHKSIVDIFDLYKQGRNLRFGHTTFDEFEAARLNEECMQCWRALVELPAINDADSDLIRKLYREESDFYYIARINNQNQEMLVKQFGNKNAVKRFSQLDMRARLGNRRNGIKQGDLYIFIDDKYIKISPFIQYNDKEELFMMLMDIETAPLAFKMAYVYRTQYASESVKYLDEFPEELRPYFPQEGNRLGKNGIVLNSFSQYKLFEQDYYKDVHEDVQRQLDQFISGNMVYGAVRGLAGVGKTSTVFMWMKRILNNENRILDEIRQKFNFRRIIFLSAKTKIYSRDINSENLSNFCDIDSDVSSFEEIVEAVYKIFHTEERKGVRFEDKEDYVRKYSNRAHGVLIILDDYESLPEESRKRIQLLKDVLNPRVIKILITTRFPSEESKNIIVEGLNEDDCATMTDYIFEDSRWRNELSAKEMYKLTGGLPLLIWYAKAYYKMGQLTSRRLQGKFTGPAEGLEGYLYDNFIQCFNEQFSKNFLMVATRYYKLHNILQISKPTAVFLCLKDAGNYKAEDEEFYFRELMSLKLISINQTVGTVDFSPLMPYMDRAVQRQEPQELYQEDALKILVHLDEKNNRDLFAVIHSVEFLDEAVQYRVLRRMADFAQNDEAVREVTINRLFELTDDKIKLYKENESVFQNSPILISAMIQYLLGNTSIIAHGDQFIQDFIQSVSVTLEHLNPAEEVACKVIELLQEFLSQSLAEREEERIRNTDLDERTRFANNLLPAFFEKVLDLEKRQRYRMRIADILEDIAIYTKPI